MKKVSPVPAHRTLCAEDAMASAPIACTGSRSEEHTSELQSQSNLVCRLLLEKKKTYSQYCCSTVQDPWVSAFNSAFSHPSPQSSDIASHMRSCSVICMRCPICHIFSLRA